MPERHLSSADEEKDAKRGKSPFFKEIIAAMAAPGARSRLTGGWRTIEAYSNHPDARVAGLRMLIAETVQAAFEWFFRAIARELDAGRGALWLPLLLGLGEAAYFTLPREPSLLATSLTAMLAVAAAIYAAFVGRGQRLLVPLACLALGFALAKLDVEWHRGEPRLERVVTGRLVATVENVEARIGGVRLELAPESFADLKPATLPRLLRIAVPREDVALHPGDRVALTARAGPPSPPVVPGGFDLSFLSFFRDLGGTGFAYGHVVKLNDGGSVATGFDTGLARMRQAAAARIDETLHGDPAAIAAALIVGERGAISDKANTDIRTAGIYHVIAISGFHMTLVAAAAYFVTRALGAAIAPLALRLPLKKIGAAAAILVTLTYLKLEGTDVHATRAAIVVIMMALAVFLNRSTQSLRMVAVSALVIFVIWPHAILDPGAQMSFVSVIALISFWQFWRGRRGAPTRGWTMAAIARRTGWYLFGIAATALVAGLATAPISVGVFNQLSPLNIFANLMVSPVEDYVILPFGMIAAFAMPFGLDPLPLRIMGWGIERMLQIAAWIQSITPGSGILGAPPWPPVVILIYAGLWLCLWQGAVRWLAVPVMIVATTLLATFTPPDLLIAPTAGVAVLRMAAGEGEARQMPAIVGRADRFTLSGMLTAAGSDASPREEKLRRFERCDSAACVIIIPAGVGTENAGPPTVGNSKETATSQFLPPLRIAIARTPEGLISECLDADILISSLVAPRWCRDLMNQSANDHQTGDHETGDHQTSDPGTDRPAGNDQSPHRPLFIADGQLLAASGAVALRRTATGFTVLATSYDLIRRPWQPAAPAAAIPLSAPEDMRQEKAKGDDGTAGGDESAAQNAIENAAENDLPAFSYIAGSAQPGDLEP